MKITAIVLLFAFRFASVSHAECYFFRYTVYRLTSDGKLHGLDGTITIDITKGKEAVRIINTDPETKHEQLVFKSKLRLTNNSDSWPSKPLFFSTPHGAFFELHHLAKPDSDRQIPIPTGNYKLIIGGDGYDFATFRGKLPFFGLGQTYDVFYGTTQ